MTDIADLGIELRHGIPPFQLALPAGWVTHIPTAAARAEDARKASAIFRQAGRPDLDAELRALLAHADRAIRASKVFAVFRQEDVPLEELLPLSITASALRAPEGESLDGWVADAFRTRGAAFLDDDAKHVVRWAGETPRPEDAPDIGGVGGRTITYVIPVPGTRRMKALVLTSTIVIPDGGVIPDDVLAGIELLSDAMVSTFAWQEHVDETMPAPAGDASMAVEGDDAQAARDSA